MKFTTKLDTDLTVQSFAYMANKLARSPGVQYEQILSVAENHRSALRLIQRDVIDLVQAELAKQNVAVSDYQRIRKTIARKIDQAQQAITRIAAQYAPYALAA